MKSDLSVIIPCYNEERNLRLGALEKVYQYLHKQPYSCEILVVDDGSTDMSVRLINSFVSDHENVRLIQIPHRGKAGAVIEGVNRSQGKIVLFTDLDQATPIDQLHNLYPWFSKGYEVVIGSRNSYRRGAPVLRLAMARGFIFLRNLILDLGIKDTQCGFKAFTHEAAMKIFNRLQVFKNLQKVKGSTVTAGFDVEILYIAKFLKYKIKEIPVEWFYQDTRNVNPLKDSVYGLIDLLKIKLNSLSGVYK